MSEQPSAGSPEPPPRPDSAPPARDPSGAAERPVEPPDPAPSTPTSAATGRWAPAASRPVEPLPGDAGVPARVRNRTAGAAASVLMLAGILAALGWGWPGGLSGAAGAVIGAVVIAVLVVAAGILLRRAALWARAARLAARVFDDPVTAGGLPAVLGTPVSLHPVRPGTPPIRAGRRLRASVLPIRTVGGPLSGGRAVLVHARPDSLLPRPEDSIRVHALGSRGPFLLCRSADGVVFAADCWSFSTL